MLKFEEPPTYTESDALVLFSPEMNDNLDGLTPLSRPVCVPQVDPSFDSPFVRAYPPALASSGIAMEWLAVSDGRNLAVIGSPPLQVVNKLGMLIGFVPNEWAMVAGIAMQISLHVPILRRVVNGFSAPIPPVSETIAAQGGSTTTARRLAQFEQEGLISELNFDVPPVKTQTGVMDKANALAVKLRESKDARKERKDDQRRRILAIREGNASAGEQEGRKARKAERRAAKDVRRGNAPRAPRKLKSLVEISDRKEYNATDSLVWIVVLNLEQDAIIEGREAADEEGDFLEVPHEDWQEEIDFEEENESESESRKRTA